MPAGNARALHHGGSCRIGGFDSIRHGVYAPTMATREPLSEKMRVNFSKHERADIERAAIEEQRSVASIIRLATLHYLKERQDG